MNRAIGIGLMAEGVIGILLYGWLVFFSPWQVLILQLTAFVAVAAVLGILAWVGYALATTPPPKPIEEIEKEAQKVLEEIEKTTRHNP
jgi:predicted DNA-binding transcriptional regulator